jgi:hypothetical protein
VCLNVSTGPVHFEDACQDATYGTGNIVSVQHLLKVIHSQSSPKAAPANTQSRQTFQMPALRLSVRQPFYATRDACAFETELFLFVLMSCTVHSKTFDNFGPVRSTLMAKNQLDQKCNVLL